MDFTIYSLLFLITFMIALIGAYLAWARRTSKGARALAIVLISAAYWSFVVFLEAAATTVESKILFSKISYIAVVVTPVLYLLFVLRYIGSNKLNTIPRSLHLFVLPLIVLVLTWTNESHHLIWTGFSKIDPTTNLITYHHGIGFFVGYLVYNYILMAWATIQLVQFIFRHQDTFRSQGWIVLIASACPWIASAFYMLDVNLAQGFDLTPGSIILSGMLFIFAILKVRLLDLVPIAREALVENLKEGIMVLDEANRIQDINQAAKDQLGVQQQWVMGEVLSELEVRETSLLKALMSSTSNPHIEVGDQVFKSTFIPLKTKPESRLIVIRNITETIEKQKEIQRSAERYQRMYQLFRLMADNMPDMLWAKDLNQRYTFVNKALCEGLLHASDTDEPIGKTLEYFMERERKKRPDEPEWFDFAQHSINSDRVILETGRAGVFDEFGHIGGKFTYQDVRKAPIFDSDGKMLGIVGSSRDVTLQKEIESELIVAKERAEESDRLKTEFLSNLSHEIRTPMNSILGFISLIREPGNTPEELEEYHKAVKSGGDRLLNTINDIIDISKVDSGEMQVNNQETDLSEMMTLLHSVYNREAHQKNLQLLTSFHEPMHVINIVCDRSKLFSVLSKLLKNAIKYTVEGSIEMGCLIVDDRIRFYVKDTGIGIPKNRQKAIFDRFVQADGSKTRSYEGTGLGLSLSKAYVEMMGGTMWLESKEKQGSTFFFEIPLVLPKKLPAEPN